MSRNKQILIAILLCAAVFGAIWGFKAFQGDEKISSVDGQDIQIIPDLGVFPPQYLTTTVLEIGGQSVTAAIADDETEQMDGLGGFESMPENTGMLFAFGGSDYRDFWMKDMKFSLDILWLDEGGAILHIEKKLAPETYPKIFSSPEPAFYVLELNAGFADRHQVKIGDLVEFNPDFEVSE
jgi:hypothetical protein